VPAKYLTAQYSAHLRAVLLYHVVGGARVLAASLMDEMSIPTLNIGNNITVTDPPPAVKLNGNANVVLADVIGTCCPGAAAQLVQ
jgi:Fasciclin domain